MHVAHDPLQAPASPHHNCHKSASTKLNEKPQVPDEKTKTDSGMKHKSRESARAARTPVLAKLRALGRQVEARSRRIASLDRRRGLRYSRVVAHEPGEKLE